MDFDKHSWPDVGLTVSLPGAATYGQVTKRSLIEPGVILGLSPSVAERQLHAITSGILRALGKVAAQITADNANISADATPYLNAEARVLRTIEHLVIHDMLAKAAMGQSVNEDKEAPVESPAPGWGRRAALASSPDGSGIPNVPRRRTHCMTFGGHRRFASPR